MQGVAGRSANHLVGGVLLGRSGHIWGLGLRPVGPG